MATQEDVRVLIDLPLNQPGIADWSDKLQAYVVNGKQFTVDEYQPYHYRLKPVQDVFDGYLGWFGQGTATCRGGEHDNTTLTVLCRAETPEANRALSA